MNRIRISIFAGTALLAAATAFFLVTYTSDTKAEKEREAQTGKILPIEDTYLTPDERTHMDSLVSSLDEAGRLPVFRYIRNGRIDFNDDDRQFTPTYLIPPENGTDISEKSKKYRALAMYRTDLKLASLYRLPLLDLKRTITHLASEINSPILIVDIEDEKKIGHQSHEKRIWKLYEQCLASESLDLFWEMNAGALMEEIFLLTQHMDTFFPAFTHQDIQHLKSRIRAVYDGVSTVSEKHPGLEKTRRALLPLNRLTAYSLSAMKNQLEKQTEKIRSSRNRMIAF